MTNKSEWVFDREFEKTISAFGDDFKEAIKGKTYHNPKLKRKISIGKNPNYRGEQWFLLEENSSDNNYFNQRWFETEEDANKELKKIIRKLQ